MAYTMMSLQELLEESDFPNRTHFQSDRVYVSPDAQKVLSILDLSSQERKSVCLFEGPEGTGKTATVRAIGYELRNRGWRVFHVDIRDLVLDPDSPVKIARLVLKDFDHQRTLVIVENVHKDTERAKPIISASTAARTASFLFTQHPPSPREELTYGGELYPLTITTIFTATTPTALQGVLRKYVTARKGEDRFSDAEAVLREAEADIEKLHGQASLNLRDFFLFLEQWDPSREKLLELATSHVPSAYATKVSQLSFELKQVLLLISALATIEIEVHKDALDGTALSQLISHKLVNRRVDFVSLNHPSEARYILQILQPD